MLSLVTTDSTHLAWRVSAHMQGLPWVLRTRIQHSIWVHLTTLHAVYASHWCWNPNQKGCGRVEGASNRGHILYRIWYTIPTWYYLMLYPSDTKPTWYYTHLILYPPDAIWYYTHLILSGTIPIWYTIPTWRVDQVEGVQLSLGIRIPHPGGVQLDGDSSLALCIGKEAGGRVSRAERGAWQQCVPWNRVFRV
jgi:hypothetical protein